MKIERDKWYLTRNGEKVRVVCVDAVSTQPVVGIIAGSAEQWGLDGAYWDDEGSGSPNDLVSEYVEPPKPREFWVVIGTRVKGESEIIVAYLNKTAAEHQAALENADPWKGATYRAMLLREVIE